LNAARAEAFEVDLQWKATGSYDWHDRAEVLSRWRQALMPEPDGVTLD